MKDVKVERHSEAVGEILKSAKVRAMLEERARRIAKAAGPGHGVYSGTTPTRARVAVVTETAKAMIAEAKHGNLTRAIDAGR